MRSFRWNEWNVEHISEHGVSPEEAEEIVLAARPPFPENQGDGKWLVRAASSHGKYLQVIYVIEEDQRVYVIHSRPLTDREKRNLRRRRK